MGVMKNIATARGRSAWAGTERITGYDGWTINIALVGGEEMERKLAELPRTMHTRIWRPITREGAHIYHEFIKLYAPRRSAPRGRPGKKDRDKWNRRYGLRPGQSKHLWQSFKVRAFKTRSRFVVTAAAIGAFRRDLGLPPWREGLGFYPFSLEYGWKPKRSRSGVPVPGRFFMRKAKLDATPKIKRMAEQRLRDEMARINQEVK